MTYVITTGELFWTETAKWSQFFRDAERRPQTASPWTLPLAPDEDDTHKAKHKPQYVHVESALYVGQAISERCYSPVDSDCWEEDEKIAVGIVALIAAEEATQRHNPTKLLGPYRTDPQTGSSYRISHEIEDGFTKRKFVVVTDVFGSHEATIPKSEWESWEEVER
jgi:hypothetical protein